MQWYNTDSETLGECHKLTPQEKQILLLFFFIPTILSVYEII